MEFIELSSKKLEEIDEKLYNKIIKNYDFDCVIFIARGSFKIGYDIAIKKNVPLLEIFATRKGNILKKIFKPILQIIPIDLKIKLREKEFNSNIHEVNYKRKISFNEKIWKKYIDCKKIVIVDDSVDTGYSIKFVKEEVLNFFKNCEIKIAALNYFEKSEKIVKTDYCLYKDTIIKGPWSNDSKENSKYLKDYTKWHNSQVVK